MLAELAVNEPDAFEEIVRVARGSLEKAS
jgi:ribosomal protein L20